MYLCFNITGDLIIFWGDSKFSEWSQGAIFTLDPVAISTHLSYALGMPQLPTHHYSYALGMPQLTGHHYSYALGMPQLPTHHYCSSNKKNLIDVTKMY